MQQNEVCTVLQGKRSIMVIVPHEDDELLLMGGVIRHAVKMGMEADIVIATNGDFGCRDRLVGYARLRETMDAMAMLGVPERNLCIMGYADTGMPKADSFLTHLYEAKDGDKIYPSLCSATTYGLEEKPEYHMQRYGVHGDYCRNTFKQDLKEIILEREPEIIFTTAESDTHGDHSALYRFVCEVLDEVKQVELERNITEQNETCGSTTQNGRPYAPEVYVGLAHSVAGDENWPKRTTAFYDCPEGLNEKTDLKWNERIRISVPEEMRLAQGVDNLKYRALCCYETALEPNAVEFLMSAIKDEEIFWRMR